MGISTEESVLQSQTPSSKRKTHGHLQFHSILAERTVKTQIALKSTNGYAEEAEKTGESLFLFLKG